MEHDHGFRSLHRSRATFSDYHEIDALKTGDVILWGDKRTPRKIRGVTRCPVTDRVEAFYFAKLRRSQYPSCWTIYNRWDILKMFRGVAALETDTCTTDTECRVQASIDTWVQHIVDQKAGSGHRRAREIITQKESVGLVT